MQSLSPSSSMTSLVATNLEGGNKDTVVKEKKADVVIDPNPVPSFIQSWVLGIMMPAAIITYIFTRQWTLSVLATFAIPLLAIAQGAIGILTYRLYFGNAPLPLSPSHGVVQAISRGREEATTKTATSDLARCSSNEERKLRRTEGNACSAVPLFSLGCECSSHRNTQSTTNTVRRELPESQEPPLRLLVIGDSLAIGVGQAESCTPVLPEVIAKSLSRRYNGRTVYWTCHGAPGASTGWIVRELERAGIQENDQTMCHLRKSSSSSVSLSCSDTDDSSSDEESSTDESSVEQHRGIVRGAAANRKILDSVALLEEKKLWRERLAEHRRRFERSEILGPYDVVVIFTGSNDLKSAFFPFLLSGEDAEFRRQAAQRGGGYHLELRRVLETLNSRMKRLKSRASSVRSTVIKNVEETVERIIHSSNAPSSACRENSVDIVRSSSSISEYGDVEENDVSLPRNRKNTVERRRTYSDQADSQQSSQKIPEQHSHSNSPLVVLPGMPARALPIFQSKPLRWLAVPIVDIMDLNKRRLAASDEHNVLFVPSPTLDELVDYEQERGRHWQHKCEDDCILALRDIRRRDCRRIERDLRDYYYFSKPTTNSTSEESFLKSIMKYIISAPSPKLSKRPEHNLFSMDSIHPNDRGYDFWGRYIADAIAEKLLEEPQSNSDAFSRKDQ